MKIQAKEKKGIQLVWVSMFIRLYDYWFLFVYTIFGIRMWVTRFVSLYLREVRLFSSLSVCCHSWATDENKLWGAIATITVIPWMYLWNWGMRNLLLTFITVTTLHYCIRWENIKSDSWAFEDYYVDLQIVEGGFSICILYHFKKLHGEL